MPDTPPAKGWPALLLTALALAGGAVWLFGQALVDATEYPDYSTLNAAPTGTRLLHDALSSILPTHRLFEPGILPNAALFRIGVPRFRALDQWDFDFVAAGGRLIQTFEGIPPDRHDPGTNGWRVAADLSITVLTNLSETARAGAWADALPWHSAAVFRIDPEALPNWQTRYTLDGHPVVVESHFFDGSVILATDSFFLSNEALAKSLGAALPAALVGSAGSVFFD
ncbi:MAG: hypothetical protein LBW77_03905, partial [Verrucomicrobiota bacterium]|nr:hypothetical protein [Verrucomicrobiota bacterium]